MERRTALNLENGDRVEQLSSGAVFEVIGPIARWRNKPRVFSIPLTLLIANKYCRSPMLCITNGNLDDWIVLRTSEDNAVPATLNEITMPTMEYSNA